MKEKAYRIMQKRAKREAAIEALKAKGMIISICLCLYSSWVLVLHLSCTIYAI